MSRGKGNIPAGGFSGRSIGFSSNRFERPGEIISQDNVPELDPDKGTYEVEIHSLEIHKSAPKRIVDPEVKNVIEVNYKKENFDNIGASKTDIPSGNVVSSAKVRKPTISGLDLSLNDTPTKITLSAKTIKVLKDGSVGTEITVCLADGSSTTLTVLTDDDFEEVTVLETEEDVDVMPHFDGAIIDLAGDDYSLLHFDDNGERHFLEQDDAGDIEFITADNNNPLGKLVPSEVDNILSIDEGANPEFSLFITATTGKCLFYGCLGEESPDGSFISFTDSSSDNALLVAVGGDCEEEDFRMTSVLAPVPENPEAPDPCGEGPWDMHKVLDADIFGRMGVDVDPETGNVTMPGGLQLSTDPLRLVIPLEGLDF